MGRYNPNIYIELIINKSSTHYLAPKSNLKLSRLLCNAMETQSNIVIDKQVSAVMLVHILRYLDHHKGVMPESIAKPIRSVKMSRICADEWDANYIDSMRKKEIFQLILAANYLDIECLLHLGTAKIATLIKGKSPEEIKNILADDSEEKKRKKKKKMMMSPPVYGSNRSTRRSKLRF